ncbi:MAG: FAD-dependent oxidoreductase [Saprospiraceae bacterium]
MDPFDVGIVGQGLAGTLLSYELMKRGKSVFVIDNGYHTSSSMVAAGIINPITGKNFVLSWKFEALLPKVIETYTNIEHILEKKILYPKQIVRSIDSVQQENLWLSRSSEDYFKKYCDASNVSIEKLVAFRPKFSYAYINAGYRVNVSYLLTSWRDYLIDKRSYLQEEFDYHSLLLDNDVLVYKDKTFKAISFCEGAAAITNPYFDSIHFSLNEGVALTIKAPSLGIDFLYKDDLFFVPLGNELYWVGGGYVKYHQMVESADIDIIEKIKNILKVDFEIIDTSVALRPSTRNRRPLLRISKESENLFQFNGLGTKGTSLGPFFADIMADAIIQRDFSKYFQVLE